MEAGRPEPYAAPAVMYFVLPARHVHVNDVSTISAIAKEKCIYALIFFRPVLRMLCQDPMPEPWKAQSVPCPFPARRSSAIRRSWNRRSTSGWGRSRDV
jgi:hypothetical protein